MTQGGVFGCGKCIPCRHTRRKIWAHRIMLETTQHEHNTFATLTYSDDMLPVDGGLCPEHLRDFLKRLRYHAGDEKLRYFAVGEYGDTSQRPHYHIALFGYLGCEWQQTRRLKSCCARCSDVSKIWGYGSVHLGNMEWSSAQYLCGYVTKKMTRRDDPRLAGKYPEFARMSLKPGIGAAAIEDVSSDVLLKLSEDHDIAAINYGTAVRPLGRYLTKRLRKLRGLSENAPQSVQDKLSKEVLPLRLAARQDENNPSLKSHFIKKKAPEVRNLKSRLFLTRGKTL